MILRPSVPQLERSLAAVPAGSTAEIRSIVIGVIRQALAEAGVREGDLVVYRQAAKWSESRGEAAPPETAT